MEDSRYKTERQKSQSGGGSVGLVGLLGGSLGAGSGFGSGMVYGMVKDFVLSELPLIVKGKDVVTALADSILHGYSFAGDAAIMGAIAGSLIAMKFRDAVRYVLWGR